MDKLYSTGEVARLTGIKQHRIVYAITTNRVPEAKYRFLYKRCFDTADLRRIAKHFGVQLPKAGDNVQI